jgi:hypothetical protein
MDTAELITLVIGIALTLSAIAYFVFTRKHSENADRHVHHPAEVEAHGDASGRATLPGQVQERPAGPDAESQAVTDRGRIDPGLSGPPA